MPALTLDFLCEFWQVFLHPNLNFLTYKMRGDIYIYIVSVLGACKYEILGQILASSAFKISKVFLRPPLYLFSSLVCGPLSSAGILYPTLNCYPQLTYLFTFFVTSLRTRFFYSYLYFTHSIQSLIYSR